MSDGEELRNVLYSCHFLSFRTFSGALGHLLGLARQADTIAHMEFFFYIP